MKRLGIIGAGRIVHWFLDDLKRANCQPEIELVGIWNIHQAKAQQVAEEYGIQEAFSEVDDLLAAKNQLDLVYVGTIDETHYEYVKKALTAKINVFAEKPLALSYQQAQELYALAQQNQVLLFEGIKTGFAPAFQKAQQMIASKQLGAVRYVYATHAKVSTSGKIPDPEASKKIAGFHQAGGMYALYPVLAFCGDIQTIHYLNNAYPQNKAIQTAVLSCRHQNGAISTVVGSDAFTDDLTTKIVLDQGYIELGGRVDLYNQNYRKDSAHFPYTISVFNNQNERISFTDLKVETDGEGLVLEIDHVYQLIKTNQKVSEIVSPQISLQIIKILELTNQVNDLAVIQL